MTTARHKLKFHVKRGDIVQTIAGDDAGSKKTGKILQILPTKGVAIVEGLNLVKKCMRKTQDNPQGGIVEKEAAIAISNLRIVDAAERKSEKSKKTESKGSKKKS